MKNLKMLICKSLATCAALAMVMGTENTTHAEANVASAGAPANTTYAGDLKVASYNVYMLSRNLYPNWGQVQRADLIAKAPFMESNDVIIFNEAFDNGASDKLLSNFKGKYPNQTPVLGRSTSGWDKTSGSYSSTVIEDGGVAIVSKYPIETKEQHVYKNGCGADYHSNKGFVYAKINKDGKNIHVFGTHTQADDSSCSTGQAKDIRTSQFKELEQFIKEKKIPKEDLVLIGGDLNVNKNATQNGTGTAGTDSEYSQMLSTLNVKEPSYQGHTSTWDPKTNSIAKYYYPDLAPEYLDYVFVSKDHAQPTTWYNNALNQQSQQWSVTAYFKQYTYNDYSDHYPVIAGTGTPMATTK